MSLRGMVAVDYTYSEEQVKLYLRKIGVSANAPPTLSLLTQLVRHHLCTFPFGALNRIYFGVEVNSMDFQDIFDKLVVQGREGFCLEHNGLMEHVLKRLGFKCFPTIARQFDHKKETRPLMMMEHWVLIVEIDKTCYLVDVGYSNRGPTSPLPLDSTDSLPHRIIKDKVGYILEIANQTGYRSLYAFTPQSFYPPDMDVINTYVCHSPHSLFRCHLLLTKYTPTGSIRLLDDLLVVTKGSTSENIPLDSEKLRRDAIKSYFNITLDPKNSETLPLCFGMPL
ncbi:hypothetical protein DSO57_1009398 [Entomophthora muscae]|uniref:Uncharacterized protein n=1 Tax=Entomophthora muscae TaxID=34485 RepID=A0ACC2T6V7_9FUNG|nr:hypothetical protein DSO57_1009398 [Entomophthora muscae]